MIPVTAKIPQPPVIAAPLSFQQALADLRDLGRRYRGGDITLDAWADGVHVTIAQFEGKLQPGAFGERRASGCRSSSRRSDGR